MPGTDDFYPPPSRNVGLRPGSTAGIGTTAFRHAAVPNGFVEPPPRAPSFVNIRSDRHVRYPRPLQPRDGRPRPRQTGPLRTYSNSTSRFDHPVSFGPPTLLSPPTLPSPSTLLPPSTPAPPPSTLPPPSPSSSSPPPSPTLEMRAIETLRPAFTPLEAAEPLSIPPAAIPHVQLFLNTTVRSTFTFNSDDFPQLEVAVHADDAFPLLIDSHTLSDDLLDAIHTRFANSFICPFLVEHSTQPHFPRCPCTMTTAALLHSQRLEPSFAMFTTFATHANAFLLDPDTLFSSRDLDCTTHQLLRKIVSAWAQDDFASRLQTATTSSVIPAAAPIPDILRHLHISSLSPSLASAAKTSAIDTAKKLITNLIANNAESFRIARARWIEFYTEGPFTAPSSRPLLTPAERADEATELTNSMSEPPAK